MFQIAKYDVNRAESFFRAVSRPAVVNYKQYWTKITPTTPEEIYDRWLFAFMSIHTTWERNVEGYLAVKDLGNEYNWMKLYSTIKKSGVGLNKMRTHAIWDFQKRYWANPQWFTPQDNETMQQCRDRLVKSTYGIGPAKTSFVLEMTFPETCRVVCLDTHILQLFDYYKKDTPVPSVYAAMENHWLELCDKHDVPSPLARHIYWDQKQGKSDTRYWSFVFEE